MKKTAIFIAISFIVQAQSIQIFCPEPDELVTETNVLIAASLFGLDNLSQEKIKVFVDQIERTRESIIDKDFITYIPIEMSPGTHTIKIIAGRDDGQRSYEKEWSFRVAGEDFKKPVLTYSGKITSGFQSEKSDNEELNMGNIGMRFSGTAFDWIKFKSNVKLSTEENPLLQARNRYFFNVEFGRILDISFGDTNPRLTRFLLDGKRVRGLEASLKFGFVNIQLIGGELNRSIQGGRSVNESYSISRTALEEGVGILTLTRKGYTFKQNLLAGRLSFGRGKYGQLGISVLKVRDDLKSIKREIDNASIELETNMFDSLGLSSGMYTYSDLLSYDSQNNLQITLDENNKWQGLAPQDNIVLSTDLGMYLDHKRIVLEGELALSLLNKNIWDGPLTLAELDTLLDDTTDNSIMDIDLGEIPIDPADIENIFIIGQGISPLVPIDINAFGDSATVDIVDAIFRMPSLAMRMRGKLNYFNNYVTIEMSRVGPEFNSLGNPYLLANNNEYSASDRIQLFKNRLMLTLMYLHQDNDILSNQSNVTTQKTMMTNATIIPGPTLPTFNISYKSIDRDNGVEELEEYETGGLIYYSDGRSRTNTTSLMLSTNYRFSIFKLDHNINATTVMLDKTDKYSDRTWDSTFVDPTLQARVFNLSVNTKYPFHLKTTVNVSTNSSEFSIGPKLALNSTATMKMLTIGLRGEYSGLFKEKLVMLGGVNYTKSVGLVDVTRMEINIGARVYFLDSVSINVITKMRTNKTASGTSTNLNTFANVSYLF